MKKILLITTTFILTITALFAQNNFYKSFSFEINGVSNSIKTKDNGYACLNYGSGFTKLDSTTQLEFYNEYPNDSCLEFNRLTQTTDSGYVLTCPFRRIATKIDKNGNYLWSKRYDCPSTILGNTISDIVSTENNGFYMLIGWSCAGFAIIKCDEFGDIIWSRLTSASTNICKFIKCSNDKLMVFGNKFLSDSIYPISLHVIDSSGTLLWTKEYNNNEINVVTDIIKTKNDEYSLLIRIDDISPAIHSKSNVVLHIDSLGNVLWSKNMYSDEIIDYNDLFSIEETDDKGYVFTGQLLFTPLVGGSRAIVVKTDSLINVQWVRYYGNVIGVDMGVNIFANYDSYFAFCANTEVFSIAKLDQSGNGFCSNDSILLNTENIVYSSNNFSATLSDINYIYDSIGNNYIYNIEVSSTIHCQSSGVNENKKSIEYNIIPNPTTGLITIKAEQLKSVEVLNIQGKQVYTGKENEIDLSSQPKGIYLIKVITDKQTITRKLIKQ